MKRRNGCKDSGRMNVSVGGNLSVRRRGGGGGGG